MGEIERELQIDAVVRALPVIARIMRQTLQEIGVADLTHPQAKVLVHLKQREEMTIGEVAAGVGVTIATASEAVDRLVGEGWVERNVNPADRRQVIVRLTPKARAVVERISARRRDQVTRALEPFATVELERFVRGLQAIIATMDDCPETLVGDASFRKESLC